MTKAQKLAGIVDRYAYDGCMIKIVRTQDELQAAVAGWKSAGETVGFVPTMGALHAGHMSLVELAVERADRVVVSIFVNPTQFLPHEDFDSYPRNEAADVAQLEATGADLVYVPVTENLYPDGASRDILAGPAADGLETDFRPGFFDGVVSVVSRLFDHVKPDFAVFGEKDYQQLAVIREKFPSLEIVGGPIVRDAFGLALSSRNAYFSEAGLAVARQLNKVLFALADDMRAGGDADDLIAAAKEAILAAGFESIDYLAVRGDRLLVAAHLNGVRLIDNVGV